MVFFSYLLDKFSVLALSFFVLFSATVVQAELWPEYLFEGVSDEGSTLNDGSNLNNDSISDSILEQSIADFEGISRKISEAKVDTDNVSIIYCAKDQNTLEYVAEIIMKKIEGGSYQLLARLVDNCNVHSAEAGRCDSKKTTPGNIIEMICGAGSSIAPRVDAFKE